MPTMIDSLTVPVINDALAVARMTDHMVTLYTAQPRQVVFVLPTGRVTVRDKD